MLRFLAMLAFAVGFDNVLRGGKYTDVAYQLGDCHPAFMDNGERA
jgi:hypothetical protein